MFIDRIIPFFFSNFGRCGRCMRAALGSATVAWVLAAFAWVLWPGALGPVLLIVAALALSLNGLLHAGAFRLNLIASAVIVSSDFAPLPVAAAPLRHQSGKSRARRRREIIWLFVSGAASAAMAALALPGSARAACGDCAAANGGGWYDCITYYCNNVGQACCPPGHPYLNHCDCLCYDGTGFDCNSYSNCNYCG